MPIGSISAIAINYNKPELSAKCIESLKKQSRQPDKILLIDNGSSDGSAQILKKRFPDIDVVENNRNESFCRACNQGISLAETEFILLINNDVVLDENFIKIILSAIEKDNNIGIAGGKILSSNGKYIDSAGQILARSRKIVDRGYQMEDKGEYDKPEHMFSIAASAVLYRREMLEGIKEDNRYFDENLEFFYEDMDLAWRAQKKGWKAYYEPKALAYHERGATAKTEKARFGFLNKYYISHLNTELQLCAIRNRYLMILKNDSLKGFIKNLPFILFYELKQLAYILLFKPSLIFHTLKNTGLFVSYARRRRCV